MSISKIRTDSEEQEATVNLIVRDDQWGVQIDNRITPIYCCNCNKQLNNFYKLDGSRYGQVGTVKCSCGAEIHCTDSDNIVEYLNTITILNNIEIGKYRIDFKKTYKLEKLYWTLIKNKIGYDIISQHKNTTIDLKEIIDEIITNYHISIDSMEQYKSDKFEKLPIIINKWFELLNIIKINNATNTY
jgi:hypothetical protein